MCQIKLSYCSDNVNLVCQFLEFIQYSIFQICCITPSSHHASETMNTLRYASRAKKIRTKPVIKMVSWILDAPSISIARGFQCFSKYGGLYLLIRHSVSLVITGDNFLSRVLVRAFSEL